MIAPETIRNPRPSMRTGLESAPESFDPQVSPYVVVNPSDTELQTRLVEARDRLDKLASLEILDFIADLGVEVDLGLLEQRLAKTKVVLGERNSPYFRERITPFAAANYRIKEGVLLVPLDNNPELANIINQNAGFENINLEALHSIIHERFHSIAGHLFVARENEPDQDTKPLAIGLRKHDKLTWLDEAITEGLTLMLLDRIQQRRGSNEKIVGSYGHPRKYLEEIIKQSGIPIEKFYEAYFEQTDLNAEPGQRQPKWHDLIHELNKQCGPNFLQIMTETIEDRTLSAKFIKMNENDIASGRPYVFGQHEVEYAISKGEKKPESPFFKGILEVRKMRKAEARRKVFWQTAK